METVPRRRRMDKECEMDAQRMLGRLSEEESIPTCGNMGGPEVSNKLVYHLYQEPKRVEFIESKGMEVAEGWGEVTQGVTLQ